MVLTFLFHGIWAQDFSLELYGSEADLETVEKFHLKRSHSDSLYLTTQLAELSETLYQQGYLEAQVNSNWRDSIHLEAHISLGEAYTLLQLDEGNVDPRVLQKVGFREKLYSNKPFRPNEVKDLLHSLIEYAEDSGYPFASVKLDDVRISDNGISASLLFDSGPQITFDSLVLVEPVKVNPKFLQAYLNMSPGTPFSESLVKELPSRLSKLPYLELKEIPSLSFQNDQATTYLTLENVKANQIDGVIGFLPNAKGEGELLLTGQFNLRLFNMFGSGRSLGFQWESFKPESQLLNIDFHQPVLFRSPIEFRASFDLFKEDSTFINRAFEFNLGYTSSSRHYLAFNTRFKSARLPATSVLEEVQNFPDIADFNLSQFGAIHQWDNLDNYLEPRSGIQTSIQLSTGLKKIRRNSAIDDSLYQELDFESSQFSWEASVNGYVPIAKRWVIAARWTGGGVYNQRLFFNDLFRLGGLNSIRGFSENTFFADNFAYSRIEPRFFFETGSYLFVFYDQAWWLKYSLENNQFEDRPTGFGAGISLTTKAGIFNLAWAVGRSNNQDLGLDQSKIHFGYISRF